MIANSTINIAFLVLKKGNNIWKVLLEQAGFEAFHTADDPVPPTQVMEFVPEYPRLQVKSQVLPRMFEFEHDTLPFLTDVYSGLHNMFNNSSSK